MNEKWHAPSLTLGRRDDDSLASLSIGRDNNLNLIRMVAASTVLVSHSYPLTGIDGFGDPLWEATGYTMGEIAVAVFFVISGFLITKSFNNGRGITHWLLSRVMRMGPGLLVVLTLTAGLLGPLVTTLPLHQYFTNRMTLEYVPSNLSLWFMRFKLPGVFEKNPYGGAINGSLWTLLYEVLCYGAVLLAGIAGLINRRRAFGVILFLYLGAYAAVVVTGPYSGGLHRIDFLAGFSFSFIVGMAGYVWRDRIVLDWRLGLGLAAVAVALSGTLFAEAAAWLSIGYVTLYLAYKPKGLALRYNRLGDYSYGMYIYAFPVQQLMVHLWPGMHWYQNVALAFPITLLMAILSWHLLESRALELVQRQGLSLRGHPAIAAQHPGVTVVDPAAIFLAPDGQVRVMEPGHRPDLYDNAHLSREGAEKVAPLIERAIRDEAGKAPSQ